LHISRRIVWQEAGEKPLNWHFIAAEGSADATELAHVQRIAPSIPPPCNLCTPLLKMQNHFYHEDTKKKIYF
jgi:hypothetical protein